MLLVFFNLSNVSHSAIANSCPAVPAAASRVAMSTALSSLYWEGALRYPGGWRWRDVHMPG